MYTYLDIGICYCGLFPMERRFVLTRGREVSRLYHYHCYMARFLQKKWAMHRGTELRLPTPPLVSTGSTKCFCSGC
ncbi:Os05g0549166 [Oryza sativa Japonica Group]|uniref:Os05g0549166 protein n=1 Tax=Oryza sativa subsp. japonica TaxID=39947 RepID=A0A0N7KL70_ORYSJ|nr:hypothetical protein EE612_030999 [Oryza sativa]BAS95193.1 Os05g0549166 [Oryza sativa Japonica Group]